MRINVRVGQIWVIPEHAYCYGSGTLTLRITAVDENLPAGVEWLWVKGREQLWRGREGDERVVLVRVDAFPKTAR